MRVVADVIDVCDDSASLCVYVSDFYTFIYMYVLAAERLYIRRSEQHDACGGTYPVDGAERGQGVHSDCPVCGTDRRPGAGWGQSGYFKGTAGLHNSGTITHSHAQ